MENEIKIENKEEKNEKKELKKLKSRKSVNWDSKIEKEEKKGKVNISNINSNDLLEIEVINKDGNVEKEYVKYERRASKEFNQKREENSHNEYTKAKEFLASHKNDEE